MVDLLKNWMETEKDEDEFAPARCQAGNIEIQLNLCGGSGRFQSHPTLTVVLIQPCPARRRPHGVSRDCRVFRLHRQPERKDHPCARRRISRTGHPAGQDCRKLPGRVPQQQHRATKGKTTRSTSTTDPHIWFCIVHGRVIGEGLLWGAPVALSALLRVAIG